MTKSRSIVLIGSAALALILIASWFLLLGPRMGTPGELKAQREQVASTNQATQADIADLETMKANIGEAQKEVTDLSKRFPPSAAQSELFRLVKSAASTAGIPESNVTDLTVGVPMLGAVDGSVTLPAPAAEGGAPVAAPAPASQLGTMSLEMSVKGSKGQIVKFLNAMENIDRAYLVTSLTVGDGEEGGTASISGTMYLLPALVDPTTPVVDPAAPVTDPAAPVTDPAAPAG